MQRVKSKAPSNFKAHVNDTEKRLNVLFDHLNNEDLLKADTVQSMVELAQAIQAKDYEQAQAIHVEIMTNKTEESGNWMVTFSTPNVFDYLADCVIGRGEASNCDE